MALTVDRNHADLSSLHYHILLTHILPCLDGPSLAAFSSTSSEFYRLSTHPQLWRDICISSWPSINHPLIVATISAFPSGYRSFFSDCYPLPPHSFRSLHTPFPATPEFLISAVDVYYQNVPIFSEVEKTDTVTESFLCSPFRIDVLQSKDYVPSWVQLNHSGEKDLWLKQQKENVTLSWILINPKDKRAINMSSKSPVSVARHWLTGEVLVKFATILAVGDRPSEEEEYVECEMVVTCGGEDAGEVQVRDVSMRMEDTEGKAVAGKDGLAILIGAMAGGERSKGKERYEDFVGRKREKKMQKNQRRASVFDWICSATSTGVAYFLA